MAHSPGDTHEYPVYGAHFRVTAPLLDADGDLVSGASTPDSEVSKDQGAFADCTNEMTEIATASGMYYLDLTGAEMTAKAVAVVMKTATAGAKTTPLVLYPVRLPVLEGGTAQAGAAGTITLASGASAQDDFYNGLFVLVTNDSPVGAQYQLRRIRDYTGSSKVADIDSNWGTNPSSASTYDILIPEGYDCKAWAGKKVADPTVAGVPEADVTHWLGTAAATPTVAGVPEVDVTHVAGTAQTAGDLKASLNTIDDFVDTEIGDIQARLPAALVSGRMDSSVGAMAANVVTAAAINAAALNGKGDWNIGKTGYALSAAGVQAVWDALTSALTFAGSIGKLIVDNLNATISSRSSHSAADVWAAGTRTLTSFGTLVADIWNALTSGMATAGSIGKKLADWVVGTIDTYTGNTKQTGDNFARLGAPAGASVSADMAAVKADTAAVKLKTDLLPEAPAKNAAFAYVVKMVLASDHVTPATGLTVTMTRSIDGAAFGAATGTVTEISAGHYKAAASAADMNGDVVAHRFVAATADDLTVVLQTTA